MSAIGATESGGVHREAADPADAATKQWLREWLQQGGFEVRVDRIGNLFGLLTWTPGAPYVLLGSHLDSQPAGGRFDGAYGVLAAAHTAARLRDRFRGADAPPPLNIAVVNWFNEEGSRFQPSMMGSAVFTGKLDPDTALDTCDAGGTSVRAALTDIGFAGTDECPELASYAEIHVEQGSFLEQEGRTIGLVESNWAARKYRVSVHGEQSHTGSTPMTQRRDALYGAAKIVTAVRELADEFAEGVLHTSVGQLTVLPNSPVVVAREAQLHLDLRSADLDVLRTADTRLHEVFAQVRERAGVAVSLGTAHAWDIEPYQPAGVRLAEAAVEELGLPHRRMLTLAGHDSTNMKDVVPTVMLFVPSAGGVAHNEFEHTDDADMLAGVDVLTDVADRLCHGEGQP
ncbi:M20 family metallo-hydrolase [Saccharopolyspora sp. HNM0983]|uniref:M20 family metallo-hydrolase n=2 Tax=Saccharopolyspora montiporae TaxID=2781240 RepID=A0A929BCH6_9PSEU|nr:M20 family metallo-hydrolase [Saccharopolyspora sp. HNM0983]